MARKGKPRAKSRKTPKRRRRVPQLGMSVDQFCFSFNIGRDTFYELLKAKKAPECMLLGRRRIITNAAAQRWQEARERDTAAEMAT